MAASREAMLNSLRALRCGGARRGRAQCCRVRACVRACLRRYGVSSRRALATLSDAQREDAARLVDRLRAAGVDV